MFRTPYCGRAPNSPSDEAAATAQLLERLTTRAPGPRGKWHKRLWEGTARHLKQKENNKTGAEGAGRKRHNLVFRHLSVPAV
eukprot:gene18584-biopygen20461